MFHIIFIPFSPFKYKAIKPENGRFYYDGVEYINIKGFKVKDGKSDKVLSWNKTLIVYNETYSAETTDNPIFIYSYWSKTTGVYIRCDYNYKTDNYYIKQTGNTVRFLDAFKQDDSKSIDEFKIDFDTYTQSSIDIFNENVPRLWMTLTVFKFENKWYAIAESGDIVYTVSDSFIKELNKA